MEGAVGSARKQGGVAEWVEEFRAGRPVVSWWTHMYGIPLRRSRAVINMSTHISSFPVELIQCILTLVMADSVSSGMPSFASVCKLWRAISLGTPTMWTTLSTDTLLKGNMAWIHLTYSAGLPLFITYSMAGFSDALPRALCCAVERAGRLDISGGRTRREIEGLSSRLKEDSQAIKLILRMGMPNLKSMPVRWLSRSQQITRNLLTPW